MDYKAAITETIRAIQKTAASEEIRGQWEHLVTVASKAPVAMLPRMYQELREVLATTVQDPKLCEMTLTLKDGTVKKFANLVEADKYANNSSI